MRSTVDFRGVGSRPITGATLTVKPTSMGGTVEKLEQGMTGIYSGCRPLNCTRVKADGNPWKNTILGESFTNVPERPAHWRTPKTSLHPQEVGTTQGTKSKYFLKTKNHTNSGYHGIMFTIQANSKPLRISNLHAACVDKPRRELYRVYIKDGGLDPDEGALDPTRWREVAAGEAELPVMTGVYGALPFPTDGVKVQAGERVSFYIHAPYNKCGVAFRRFSRSWPGYPGTSHVTDACQHFSILCAKATYSQTPFERISQEGCGFAGIVEFDFSMDLLEEFLADKARARRQSELQMEAAVQRLQSAATQKGDNGTTPAPDGKEAKGKEKK